MTSAMGGAGTLNAKRAMCALAMIVIAAVSTSCEATGPLHEVTATGNAEFVQSWIAKKRNLDATYDEPSAGIERNYAPAREIREGLQR